MKALESDVPRLKVRGGNNLYIEASDGLGLIEQPPEQIELILRLGRATIKEAIEAEFKKQQAKHPGYEDIYAPPMRVGSFARQPSTHRVLSDLGKKGTGVYHDKAELGPAVHDAWMSIVYANFVPEARTLISDQERIGLYLRDLSLPYPEKYDEKIESDKVRKWRVLPEELGYSEPPEATRRKWQWLRAIKTGQDTKEPDERYFDVARPVVDWYEDPDARSKAQIGFIIQTALIKYDGGQYDSFIRDMEHAERYAQSMGYDDLAAQIWSATDLKEKY